MSEDENYAFGLEKILRWCFNKPLDLPPEIGPRPSFLDEQAAAVTASATVFRSSVSRHPDAPSVTSSSLRDFINSVVDGCSSYIIEDPGTDEIDEHVIKTIEGFRPVLNQYLDVVGKAMQLSSGNDIEDVIHEGFERLIGLYDKGPLGGSSDAVKFLTHFLFVSTIALEIRHNRFERMPALLDVPFYLPISGDRTGKGVSFTYIGSHLRSLQRRNERLKLNRLSLHADLINQLCEGSKISMTEFMQADLVIYVRLHITHGPGGGREGRWWPTSLLYASYSYGAFPLFIRAQGGPGWERMLQALGTTRPATIREFIAWVDSNPREIPTWQFDRPDFKALMNFEKLDPKIS